METLTVHTTEKGAELGDLFGIFFEDLNHAADGGLYAELVQNRSFEFDLIDNQSYNALTAWEKIERGNGKAEIYVENSKPLNERNLNYLVIDILNADNGVGVMNLGYNTGIPLEQGQDFLFSCYSRRDCSYDELVEVALESIDGKVYSKVEISVNSNAWTKYETVLISKGTDYSGRLVITTKGTGKLYLDMVSLFPKETFKNRQNGMRKDIAEFISAMNPKFMRFPGGCLVHDGSLNSDDRNSLYRWKNTIGDLEKRPSRRNNWGYNQTLGLGYYEYFQFSEDIGAKPLPVLPAGYDPHHQRIVPIEDLQTWIDDALDLIEFANGDTSTVWGAKRAELGHPKPFGLEYIAIGNEEVGEPFFERYPYFHNAIKEKYPHIKIINSSGPFAAGSEYEHGWKSAKENHSDLVDEHYYQSPEWFLANYHRYDNFKADEPKVFLGEYASWGNTYYNALVEAAYMTGLEKNAHAVGLACYAPMLCNVDYISWKPDMIWFNNHKIYATPNYYVQKLFMNHQGDRLLKVELNVSNINKPKNIPITGKIVLSSDKTCVQYYNVKLKNNDTFEEKLYHGLYECTETDSIDLDITDWGNYTLSMTAKKISGLRGFNICFGKKDDANRLFWEVGGWQNQDAVICADVNGKNSCLTQSLFAVETNKEYQLELKVSGRKICTYIDGKLFNETEDKLPIIEPLYYSASIENDTGDIIIKVVNVQGESVQTELNLTDIESGTFTAKIYELTGYDLSAENNFEFPELIVPKEKDFILNSNYFYYEFLKHSITIFRISV